MPKYFHYTTVGHFGDIAKDRFVKLVESNVSLSEPHKGPDVVWLFPEPLKSVPEMMFTYLMNESGEWTGDMVSKAQIELEVTLEKSEVTRADKFLKKHGASKEDMEKLEDAGKFKFIKQYVAVEPIPAEKITNVTQRGDLLIRRKGTPLDRERLKLVGPIVLFNETRLAQVGSYPTTLNQGVPP